MHPAAERPSAASPTPAPHGRSDSGDGARIRAATSPPHPAPPSLGRCIADAAMTRQAAAEAAQRDRPPCDDDDGRPRPITITFEGMMAGVQQALAEVDQCGGGVGVRRGASTAQVGAGGGVHPPHTLSHSAPPSPAAHRS